jgi:hypothetical protein
MRIIANIHLGNFALGVSELRLILILRTTLIFFKIVFPKPLAFTAGGVTGVFYIVLLDNNTGVFELFAKVLVITVECG